MSHTGSLSFVKHPISNVIASGVSAKSALVRNIFTFMLEKTSQKTIMNVSHIAGSRKLPEEKYKRASDSVCRALSKNSGLPFTKVGHLKLDNNGSHVDFYQIEPMISVESNP